MSKQDRQGVRTPADLEQKYNFGQSLSTLEETTIKQGSQIELNRKAFDDFAESTNKELSSVNKNVSSLNRTVSTLQDMAKDAEARDIAMSKNISGLEKTIEQQKENMTVGELTVEGNATVDGALSVGDAESTRNNLGVVPATRKVNGKQLTSDVEDVDYVVEQGASGIWTYRKWKSGIAECWGYTATKTVSMVAWGNGYESSETIADSVSYPFTFKAVPVVSATPKHSAYNWSLVTNGSGSTTSTPSWYAFRPSAASGVKGAVYLYVIGKWK